VSALSLHPQLETGNRFLEIVTILRGGELECPDQPPARLLLCIARDPGVRLRDPGVRLRDIAAGPGSTERRACGIVTGPTAAGCAAKQKRRPPQPLPDPGAPPAARTRQPGTRHRRRPGPARGRRRETAADPDRTSLRPPHPTRSSAMDPDHRRPFPARAFPRMNRGAHAIAALSGEPGTASVRAREHLPGLLPCCRQRACHRLVPDELP
jgi:hypothetical protein